MTTLKSQRGFTLIELVLVVVVLAILAAVALTQYGSLLKGAKDSALQGAVGAYHTQLAISLASLRVIPSGGTGGQFDTQVFQQVSVTGSGVVLGSFEGGTNEFNLCAGPTACPTGAAPACGGSANRFIRATYNAASGALRVAGPNDCS